MTSGLEILTILSLPLPLPIFLLSVSFPYDLSSLSSLPPPSIFISLFSLPLSSLYSPTYLSINLLIFVFSILSPEVTSSESYNKTLSGLQDCIYANLISFAIK